MNTTVSIIIILSVMTLVCMGLFLGLYFDKHTCILPERYVIETKCFLYNNATLLEYHEDCNQTNHLIPVNLNITKTTVCYYFQDCMQFEYTLVPPIYISQLREYLECIRHNANRDKGSNSLSILFGLFGSADILFIIFLIFQRCYLKKLLNPA